MQVKNMLVLKSFDEFKHFSIHFEKYYKPDDFKLNNIDVRKFLNKLAIKRIPELLNQLEPYLSLYSDYLSRNFDKIKPYTGEINLKQLSDKLKNLKRYYTVDEYKLIVYLIKQYNQDKINDVDKNILIHLLDKQLTIEDLREEKELALTNWIYFLLNYLYVKNKIVNIDDAPESMRYRIFNDKLKYIPYLIQFRFLDLVDKHNRVVSVKTRQIGFTTSLAGYLSLYAIANSNKTILIISKSFEDAKTTLEDSVKFPLKQLPFFLRKYVSKEIMSLVKLGSDDSNSSTIRVMTSGKSSGRSISASILVLDEANFIANVDKLLSSAAPTLSATGGKGIVLSTPEKPGLFQELVLNADNGNNGLQIVLGYLRIIEDRTLDWYKSRIQDLNFRTDAIKTELEMELITPQTSIIPKSIFENISVKTTNDVLDSPEYNEIEKQTVKTLHKYMPLLEIIKPVYPDSNEHLYLISVDTYEGGIDTNAITILDIKKGFENAQIVATGKTKIEEIAENIANVAELLKALVLIEKNRGYHLIHQLFDRIPDQLLPNFTFAKGEFKAKLDSMRLEPDKLGLYTTREIKNKGISLLIDYLASGKDIPVNLYDELKYLKILKNGRIEGMKGDDIIMSASIGLLYTLILDPLFSNKKIFINNEHHVFLKLFKRKYKKYISKGRLLDNQDFETQLLNDQQKSRKLKRIYYSI